MLQVLALIGLLLAVVPAPALADGLFVVGRESRSVLEFDAADGSLTRVFAETMDEGFQNPGGIALSPAGGDLYVTSRGSGEIWRYDTPTGDVLSPAVATGLFRPGGCDFDATGAFLYFTDSNNVDSETADAVRRLEIATGLVSAVGTTANADFADVAVSGGFVFATDTDGHRVMRFPISGGPGSSVVGTGLAGPRGLVFRSPTRMLVADTGSDRVLEFVEASGSWSFDRVVVPATSGVGDPCGLAIAPDTTLSVTGCATNDVVQVDLGTLAISPGIAPGAGGLGSPKDAAWSGSTLLVASGLTNQIVYFDASGEPNGIVARGQTTQLDAGFGFSADGARLAVASTAEGDVVELDAETGALLRIFNNACFLPMDVAYGPGADLYVACLGGNEIVRLDGVSGTVHAFVLGGAGGLVAPRTLAFGPNGNLFASSASGEVLEFDGGSGWFIGDFIDSTGNGGGAIDPQGFRFHGDLFYLASEFTDEVKVFDATTGAFLDTLISGSGLDAPTALDIGPNGDLFVASGSEDSVRRYDPLTGVLVEVFVGSGAGGLDTPVDLAFRPVPEASVVAGVAAGMLALAALGRPRPRRRARTLVPAPVSVQER